MAITLLSPIEVAGGVIDGANKDFTTSGDYISGTTQVWLNGQAKVKADDDGWDELGGKDFRMKIAPRMGDRLQVQYRPV